MSACNSGFRSNFHIKFNHLVEFRLSSEFGLRSISFGMEKRKYCLKNITNKTANAVHIRFDFEQ